MNNKIMKFQSVLMGIQYFFPLKTGLKPIKEISNEISIGFNEISISFSLKNRLKYIEEKKMTF